MQQSHTFFPRVVDQSDPEFDPRDPRMAAEAQQQRVREIKIAEAEMYALQHQLKVCYQRNAPDHFTKCKDLVTQYKERLDWGQNGIPPVGANSQCRLRRAEDGYVMLK